MILILQVLVIIIAFVTTEYKKGTLLQHGLNVTANKQLFTNILSIDRDFRKIFSSVSRIAVIDSQIVSPDPGDTEN